MRPPPPGGFRRIWIPVRLQPHQAAEVLGLEVSDVDVGRGWVRVIGKGDKERHVPLDPDVASLVQTYLNARRRPLAPSS